MGKKVSTVVPGFTFEPQFPLFLRQVCSCVAQTSLGFPDSLACTTMLGSFFGSDRIAQASL